MRNLIILCAFVTSSMNVFGQTFSISNVYMAGDPMTTLTGHAQITNTASSTKYMLVERTVNNLFPGHTSYFCLIQCYNPATSLALDTLEMPAMSTTGSGGLPNFYADVETGGGISGISVVSFCFFDIYNHADSACVEYVFDATSGFNEIPAASNYISNVYPNPATTSASFYYKLASSTTDASVRISNMLGAEVKRINLNENQGVMKMDLQDLRPGIYFYTLSANGKTQYTGKFIVAGNLQK